MPALHQQLIVELTQSPAGTLLQKGVLCGQNKVIKFEVFGIVLLSRDLQIIFACTITLIKKVFEKSNKNCHTYYEVA